jgi:hypothetical protein
MIRQKVYQLEQTQIKMKQEYVTPSFAPPLLRSTSSKSNAFRLL